MRSFCFGEVRGRGIVWSEFLGRIDRVVGGVMVFLFIIFFRGAG